jgi:hypothetical protein
MATLLRPTPDEETASNQASTRRYGAVTSCITSVNFIGVIVISNYIIVFGAWSCCTCEGTAITFYFVACDANIVIGS